MAAATGKSRIAAMLIPPVVVLGGVLALWENEGRFDYAHAAGKAVVVNSAAQGATADTAALTGELDTGIAIPGDYVGVFDGYLLVERDAEIYSWKEREEDGKSTWTQGWHGSLQRNSRNGQLRQTLRSRTLLAPRYAVGDLEISPARLHFVDERVPVDVGSLALTPTAAGLGLSPGGNVLYKGRGSEAAPQLGDERVTYRGIPTGPRATYFGRIAGGEGVGKQFQIERSVVSSLIGNDGVLHHLVKGARDESLEKMASHFQRTKWLVRAVGTLAVVIGIYAFFSAFVNLLYRIPLLGSLVSTGVFVLSLALGLTISLLVMLSSVLFHNPLTVALPLVLVVTGVVFFARRAKEARANAQETLRAKLEARQEQQRAGEVQRSLEAKLASTTGPGTAPASGSPPVEDTFVNLAKLALAEGGLDEEEKKYLVRWGLKSGISRERMKELFARARKEGGALTATHRDDLTILACLALADGVLSTRELKHLLDFAKRLGMSAADVRQVIVEVESPAPA